MLRRIAGAAYAALAVAFAAAAVFLLVLSRLDAPLLSYALVLVFGLGSVVSAKSAREAFVGSQRGRVRSS